LTRPAGSFPNSIAFCPTPRTSRSRGITFAMENRFRAVRDAAWSCTNECDAVHGVTTPTSPQLDKVVEGLSNCYVYRGEVIGQIHQPFHVAIFYGSIARTIDNGIVPRETNLKHRRFSQLSRRTIDDGLVSRETSLKTRCVVNWAEKWPPQLLLRNELTQSLLLREQVWKEASEVHYQRVIKLNYIECPNTWLNVNPEAGIWDI
jgi:hypothetical protein